MIRNLVIIIIFTLSSCGFHAVFNPENKIDDNESYKEELAAIRIIKERKRINQVLRNNFYDIFNPDNLKVEPKYALTVTLVKSLTSTFTTTSGAPGRNKVIISAHYRLIDLESGELVGTGDTNAKDDFDVDVNKRFANEVTQEAIELNLTKIIARNLRNMIIADLTAYFKNGKKSPIVIEEEKE